MRLLVTGSRLWPCAMLVTEWLDHYAWRREPMTLVHGACRYGVDAVADMWARKRNRLPEARGEPPRVIVERHPAEWDRFGKAARPILRRWRPRPVFGYTGST